ncbi:endolytic transglycosylase MltG [Sediminibacillus halophilus]|uniref:YceG-like family protein n=1 Tax=Sediminibacillus halophilus TaxID=482461 RepID=A0A1G9YHS2_9BACI|nr:endolytic transglycosylase MltG [Sediminibacillus halophilus]SDN08051.1 YceG-like family protein [Sediminibacillus halophilus]
MKQPIRAFALGLLSAVLVLGVIYYIDGKTAEQKTEMQVSEMVTQLEAEGYVVKTLDEIQTEQSEDKTAEGLDEKNEEEKDEENTEEQESMTPASIDLHVEPGMSTEEIIDMLYEAGIIEDKQSFSNYLTEHDYSTGIQTGEFHIEEGMTYQEIAETITR